MDYDEMRARADTIGVDVETYHKVYQDTKHFFIIQSWMVADLRKEVEDYKAKLKAMEDSYDKQVVSLAHIVGKVSGFNHE